MNIPNFVVKHRPAFEEFLKTEMGRDFMSALIENGPVPSGSGNASMDSYTLGRVAGYGQCVRLITAMAQVPENPAKQPKQNYGVKDPEPSGKTGA